MFVVLAPIDEHLAFAQFFFHIRNYQPAMLVFQQSRERMCKGLGDVIAGWGIQWNINLESFRAGCFGKAPQTEVLEDLPKPEANLGALHDVRGEARIQIKHHHGGLLNFLRQRERGVQFNCG